MRTSPNLPYFGLDVVAKFPLLTQESYRKAYGSSPRAFDYGKPIKRWSDPAADPASPDRPEFIPYQVATKANGGFVAGQDGFVQPTDTGMSADEAWAVNIPPDIGLGTVPGTTNLTEARMPIYLLPNERLQQAPFGGGLRVRNLSVPDTPAPTGGSFTETDRITLYKIAAKVGV